jgi:uncharacterized RDD family membrane protein YckC
MPYAGVGHRFAAVFLESIVLFFAAIPVAFVTGDTWSESDVGGKSAGFDLSGKGFLLWLLVCLAYYVFMEAGWGGSLGKLAVGLRVVDEHGRPITVGQAMTRNLFRVVDFIVFYFLAALSVWSSPQRQRLGDRVAGTYVVRAHETAAF